jgi:hypothetical protein
MLDNFNKLIAVLTSLLASMDIIFFGSDSFIGKLIRKAQEIQTPDKKPSLWSHVAFYFGYGLILESTIGFEPYRNGKRWDNGIQFYSLEQRIKSSGNNIAVFKLKASDEVRERLKQRAIDLYNQNIKYPILGLLGSLLTYWIFPTQYNNPLCNEKYKLYCSAFVADVLESYYGKLSVYSVDNISPELLYRVLLKRKDIGDFVSPITENILLRRLSSHLNC